MLDKNISGHVSSTLGVKIHTCMAGREILKQNQQAKRVSASLDHVLGRTVAGIRKIPVTSDVLLTSFLKFLLLQ